MSSIRKVLFYTICCILFFPSCESKKSAPIGPGLPPNIEWSLSIVRFTQSDYKNYVLARKITHNDDVNPSYEMFVNPPISDTPGIWTEQNPWTELGNGFLCCSWQWPIFYGVVGGYIDAVLINERWENLPSESKVLQEDSHLLDFLYYTTDPSLIKDANPFGTYYLIQVKNIYAFIGKAISPQDSLYVHMDPLYAYKPGSQMKYNIMYLELINILTDLISKNRLKDLVDYDTQVRIMEGDETNELIIIKNQDE